MKILHIVSSKLTKRSGITGVFSNLPMSQNKIDGVEARAFLVNNTCEDDSLKIVEKIDFSNFEKELVTFNPDIAIIHDFYLPIYAKISKVLRKNKIPYCLEPHGAFGRNAMKKSYFKKIVANNTLFRNTIKKASSIIFTMPSELKDAVYHNKNETIIENGIKEDIVLKSIKSTKGNLDSPVLYFMGRFRIFHKGLDYLFDALDVLNERKADVSFKVFGTSTEQEVEYVKSRIDKLNNLNVTYCGVVYGEDRDVELINNCNILCLTSRYEGSPLAVLDAFSCGNAVLVTPGTNVSDEVVENKLGWRAELDPVSIADTILKAIEEYKKDAKGYISRVNNYVLEKYTWDKVAALSVVEYKKILEKLRNSKR